MLDAVIVGAGQSGLAASWHLANRGIEHVVLEQGRVGESWRSQRWDTFQLNSPMWANRLPGDHESADLRDAFLTRDAWVAHLDALAGANHLPLRAGVRVSSVERTPDGSFQLGLLTPEPETLRARTVILASGYQRVPRLPALARSVPAGIVSIHAADYRRPDALPPGAVLVVGAAQSGGQIAEDLLDAGRAVYLSAGSVGRMPRRYRGRDIFAWLVQTGFFDQTVAQLPDPRLARAAQPILSGVGVAGHTLSLQLVAARGATLLGHLLGIDRDRLTFATDLADSIRMGDRVSADIRSSIEREIAAHGDTAPAVEPDTADEPVAAPDALAAQAPSTLDLDRAGVSTIVWSTGFGADLSWVHLPVTDAAGNLAHRDGTSTTPGIWFIGVPWMRTRKSAIVLGAGPDAALLADEVTAFLVA